MRPLRLRIGFAVAVGSCASGQPTRDAVLWMNEAVRVNRLADEAMARGDRESAYAALIGFVQNKDALREARFDKSAVLMDAYFRLAEMALAARNAPAALLWSSRGLALGAANDLFTANLYIAKGHAALALGDDTMAGESFHKALAINEALLSIALGETGR